MRLSAPFAALLAFAGSTAAASPIQVVRGALNLAPTQPQQVLYTDGDLSIVRSVGAEAAAFANLYVVNMSNRLSADSLQVFGDVLHITPTRFAVMRVAPEQVGSLAGKLHHEGLSCGVLTKLHPEHTVHALADAPTPLVPVTKTDPRVVHAVAAVQADHLKALINELAALPTRYQDTDSGSGVAAFLATKYQTLAAGRSDVTIARYSHGWNTPQDSLVVRIEGSKSPDEVLILGSHLDSVNWRDGSSERSPGADDNASGTATNLEIFCVLMAEGIRPERTLEIHAYAAEEAGLVGSQDIANAYRNKGVNVVAMLQYDMDFYRAQGDELKVWLISNNTSRPLNAMLGQLVEHYIGIPWEERYLSGGSSDHASWHRAGFAAAFPFENPGNYNHHIHSADDTIENSGDYALATAYTKLGTAYALHFAGLD